MSEKSGMDRRHFLTVATSVTGVAGLGMAAAPFVMSFKPSARAQALGAPVQVDISKLDVGEMARTTWRGKTVFVVRRSPEMLERMAQSDAELADPNSEVPQQPGYAQNIVIGIPAAYFSNYLILSLGQSDLGWAQSLRIADWNWRWMLGVEALPAIFYFFALLFVPESPRWLVMRGRTRDALDIMEQVSGPEQANTDLQAVQQSLDAEANEEKGSLKDLFQPAMKLVLTIGISVAILQQITGINSVFFYAPMIFEQSGIGTDAAFMQAVLVGLVNLVFTVTAILLIDKLGRRPLMLTGLFIIAFCMLLLAYGFSSASYTDSGELMGVNPVLILIGILGFVAGFAISLGPVMWVLFSELFPNRIRGIAISFVGLINSSISFIVQLVFPWELENFGPSITFLIYGAFAVAGLIFVWRTLPETKGRSLEELEVELVSRK